LEHVKFKLSLTDVGFAFEFNGYAQSMALVNQQRRIQSADADRHRRAIYRRGAAVVNRVDLCSNAWPARSLSITTVDMAFAPQTPVDAMTTTSNSKSRYRDRDERLPL
jgi:hypothetical protein